MSFARYLEAPVFLLTACGGLTSFLSVESFQSFSQEHPRYFEGIPLCYQEFVFDVSDYATRYVAETKMVDLSKSEGLEYSQEIFLFGFATFSCGEIGVQGVRCFRKRVLMLRVVATRIAKSRLQGNRSGLRKFEIG